MRERGEPGENGDKNLVEAFDSDEGYLCPAQAFAPLALRPQLLRQETGPLQLEQLPDIIRLGRG